MKNTKLFYLFLIIIFGFLLRIYFLDKPEGLWNDEYLSWYIASEKNLWLFFQHIVRNCHAPFYYIYLKIWIFIFSDADISLRYSSVIPSVISIPIMYYAGKELKDSKLGFLTAFVTAISSFLIYFAQEVRLYSLLFLFSAITTFFAIRVQKKFNKPDLILLFISCFFVIFTHTLGIIYVFLLLILTSYFIVSELDKKQRKKFIYNLCLFVVLPTIAIIILISPFLLNIVTYSSLSQFWSEFSFSKIILTVSDYFSPIQYNLINTYHNYSTYIYNKGVINYKFITFSMLPLIISIIAIINAIIQKNKIIYNLFITISLFFVYLIFIAYTGRMILITKYSLEMYPALILIFSFGITNIKNKKISMVLVTLFIMLNLIYLFKYPDAVQKQTRPEGHRAAVELIRAAGLKNSDFVVFLFSDENKFNKYFNKDEHYKIYSINKFNFNYFLYNDSNYKNVIKNGKYLYKNDFKTFPNKNIVEYSQNTFINNMKKGDKIGIISMNSMVFLNNDEILAVVNNDEKYKTVPYIYLVFSLIRNSLYSSFKDKYEIDTIIQAGYWTITVFVKTKD